MKLDNLIAFWYDSRISIDGNTNVTFTENVIERYKAYGWHIIEVSQGDTDIDAITRGIEEAKAVKDKPTLIRLTTTIGFGSLVQGTHGVHGSPLKKDDIKQLKVKFGFNTEMSFYVPQSVSDLYIQHVKENQELEAQWNKTFATYKQRYPNEGAELERRLSGRLPSNWPDVLPRYGSRSTIGH